jgi:hypothetical protein
VNRTDHPERHMLIDYLEGELSSGKAEEIRLHLASCEPCRSYARSLEETFSLLAQDTVPEPSPGFWAYLTQRVRHRVSSRRRRLVLVFAPGLAALFIVVVMVWWSMRTPVEGLNSIDLLLADMSTGEIVESLSGSPAYDEVVVEAASEEIRSLDEYFIESEDIYDLIDALSEEEREELFSEIRGLMNEAEGTSKVMTDFAGKEC